MTRFAQFLTFVLSSLLLLVAACAVDRQASPALDIPAEEFERELRADVVRAVDDLDPEQRKLLADCLGQVRGWQPGYYDITDELACYPSLATFRSTIRSSIYKHRPRDERYTTHRKRRIDIVVEETVRETLGGDDST